LDTRWGSSPWCTLEAFPPIDSQQYVVGKVEVVLDVGMAAVRDLLARELKPNRKLVNAVLFKDGTMAEATFAEDHEPVAGLDPPVEGPHAAPPPPAATPRTTPPRQRPAAGATVAAPERGCPAPDFSPAEIRAKQVLHVFLDEEQRQDIVLYDRFVAVGHDTGHRYMLVSRTNRKQLDLFGGRTLYDLDEDRAYCVHDWDVPSGEELLALLVFLRIPGKESYLREIPEETYV
jgi:hypothetical protein